ncbi:MAG: ABC transporter permease protein [Candidatus Carbobacillus altaicus]|uniref:ABC transporter permease protein n=1 Tax=Candidatus Carbonibacillus altaicus TaxID=2163959 RepID=A0A2R6Y1L6_9BACL|nr:MAG: ABC transporter permease protein [Candidatus Carbobacillus altaicus]
MVADLVFKTWIRRYKETGLTALLLAFIGASIVFMLWFILGYKQGVTLASERLGADVVLFPKDVPAEGQTVLLSGEPLNVYFPEKQVLASLQGVQGLDTWTPQFFTQTLNADCCSVEGENRLVGIDWASDFLVKPWIRGHVPETLGEDEAIIGANVATYEDDIMILDAPFHIVARLYPTGTAMDQTIFIPLQTARDLVFHSDTVVHAWGKEIDPYTSLSAVFIRAKERYNPALLAYHLNQIPDVQVIETSDVLYRARETFTWTGRMLMMAIALFTLLAVVAVYGRLVGDVTRRRSDFALMRSLGLTTGKVVRWFGWESLFTALAALILAMPVYGLYRWIFSRFSAANPSQPFVPLSYNETAGVAFLVFLVFWLIIFLSQLSASRHNEKKALSQSFGEGDVG